MTYRTLFISTAMTAVLAGSASAHFIGVAGNNSIDGSLCVGFDCVAEESFGFDTIRLKENNLRLHFEDTSAAASFPPNDWRIRINDSANGGASYFGVEDTSAGRTPFRVDAGARNNALYVDSQGDVGIGTSTPATDIDIKIGDTPTVRLQQDNTSGFTPQTWDVAGNEAGFFIRDVTSGSTLPFRIMTGGAPSQALVIDSAGHVGIGAGTNPDEELHVQGPANETVALQLETTGTNAQLWRIRNQGGGSTDGWLEFRETGGNIPMRIAPGSNSNLLLIGASAVGTADADRVSITGELFINGVDNSNPDYVFEPDYALKTIDEQAAYMFAHKHLPAVGGGVNGTDGKAVINVATRSQGVLEELEKAHIYIAQLHERLARLEARLDASE